MSVFAGQALVYLKIGMLAGAIMIVAWVVIRVVEALGKRENEDANDGK